MKLNASALLLCLLLSSAVQAQTDVKVNVLGTLFRHYQVTVEQGAEDDFSLGLGVSYAKWKPLTLFVGDDPVELGNEWDVITLLPHARLYMNPQEGNDRFFVEGYSRARFSTSFNHTVSITDPDTQITTDYDTNFKRTGVFVGVGIGSKWIANNGFFFDMAFGLGRRIYADQSYTNATVDDFYNADENPFTFVGAFKYDARFAINFGWRLGG